MADPAPTIENNPTPPATPTGKTWSDDYVQSLREEAKSNRVQKNSFAKMLRDVLGLKDEEEVTEGKIAEYKTKQQQATTEVLQKANDRLITAEIKALQGYDTKLVERLVDRKAIKIDENGSVSGLKEAVEALEKEFPSVKMAPAAPAGGGNPPLPPTDQLATLHADYEKATSLAEKIQIRTKISALEREKG